MQNIQKCYVLLKVIFKVRHTCIFVYGMVRSRHIMHKSKMYFNLRSDLAFVKYTQYGLVVCFLSFTEIHLKIIHIDFSLFHFISLCGLNQPWHI